MIAIVNYGLGNIQAFVNCFQSLGVETRVATAPEELQDADRIVLPGVGAFDRAISLLEASGMRPALTEKACNQRVPVLGVCVGMQLMARSSEEGSLPGLCWIDAEVRRIKPIGSGAPIKLPHMGWNDVTSPRADKLFRGLESDARFYFLHSYYFHPSNGDVVIGVARYGTEFASAVRVDNLWGVQFHPEKSHQWGMQLLKNFSEC
jgi:glutamine amidotransferase